MESPKISVIIPAYNAEKTIKNTLTSIKALTLAPIECIVVDDGSDDNTCEIAKKEGAIVLSADKNMGPGLARNLGAQNAKGEYLAFTDSDCVVPPDWLEKFYAAFKEQPCSGITGPYAGPVRMHRIGKVIDRWLRHNQRKVPREIFSCISSNLFVKKKDFKEIGGFPTYKLPGSDKFYYGNEDEEFANLLAFKKKQPFIWLKDNGIFHDYRENLRDHFKQQSYWVEAILVSIARFPSISNGEESNYSTTSSVVSIFLTWLAIGSLIAGFIKNPVLFFGSVPFFVLHKGHVKAIIFEEKLFKERLFLIFYAYFFVALTSIAWSKGLISGGSKFARCYFHWRIRSHA